MLTISDAVFFLSNNQVVKEMLMSEFEAFLDGIVEAPEFAGEQVTAAFLQIDDKLKIRGLVCFYITFTHQGLVEGDWNVPLQQLLQSAGRGPDLGGGKIRLVCRSQCSVPWHQHSLWDPKAEQLQLLVNAAANNRVGIVESEGAWDESWDVPGLDLSEGSSVSLTDPPVLTAEPPVLGAESEIPVLGEELKVPVLTPNDGLGLVVEPELPDALDIAAQPNVSGVEATAMADLSAEMTAMKAAYSVKMDKLQKAYDELSDKHQSSVTELKQQAKSEMESLTHDFQTDLDKRERQVEALKTRLKGEQKRYSELKEQQVEMAAGSQLEREQLLSKMQNDQDVGSEKIEQLQQAFKKELHSRLDAETTKANDGLALREVELFYRNEQLALLRDDAAKLKSEKQAVLAESGNKILSSLEDNGVTLVAFHVGVGHITIPSEDVGRYLDQRSAYLAERCQVTLDEFNQWQAHYSHPACQHVGDDGSVCGKATPRVELVSSFKVGISDRCSQHMQMA